MRAEESSMMLMGTYPYLLVRSSKLFQHYFKWGRSLLLASKLYLKLLALKAGAFFFFFTVAIVLFRFIAVCVTSTRAL